MRDSANRQAAALAAGLCAAGLCTALLLLLAPLARAGNGGVSPPGGDGDRPKDGGSGDRKPGGEKASGARLRLIAAEPGKAFFDGRRRARFSFELRGKRRRNIVVTAVRAADREPVKSWELRRVSPGKEPTIRWAGLVDGGMPVAQGAYEFVVKNANGTAADTSKAEGDGRVRFFGHKFPVHGDHGYGDGLGAGRRHQGFDIPAACRTPIVAARGGRVQWRKFQRGGAGHYLVIDGWRTSRDYVYMHLRERPQVSKGDRVKTGELLGYTGSSGHSTGCHLHFEVWSAPGWGAGGDFLDAERLAKRWDRWS